MLAFGLEVIVQAGLPLGLLESQAMTFYRSTTGSKLHLKWDCPKMRSQGPRATLPALAVSPDELCRSCAKELPVGSSQAKYAKDCHTLLSMREQFAHLAALTAQDATLTWADLVKLDQLAARARRQAAEVSDTLAVPYSTLAQDTEDLSHSHVGRGGRDAILRACSRELAAKQQPPSFEQCQHPALFTTYSSYDRGARIRELHRIYLRRLAAGDDWDAAAETVLGARDKVIGAEPKMFEQVPRTAPAVPSSDVRADAVEVWREASALDLGALCALWAHQAEVLAGRYADRPNQIIILRDWSADHLQEIAPIIRGFDPATVILGTRPTVAALIPALVVAWVKEKMSSLFDIFEAEPGDSPEMLQTAAALWGNQPGSTHQFQATVEAARLVHA